MQIGAAYFLGFSRFGEKTATQPQVNQKARVDRPETVVNERQDFVHEQAFQYAWDTT